jgi:AraC-like DNA-binding protein
MTSITEKTSPGAGGAIGQRPDTTPSGPNPARPAAADDSARPVRGPAATRHDQARTIDSRAVRQFFAGVYSPGWRVTGLTSRSAVSYRRCEAGLLTIDDVMIQGRMAFEIPASDTVVVIQPRAGSIGVASGQYVGVDAPVLVADGMSCALQCNGARFDVVSIAADAMHKVVADWRPPLLAQSHFLDWHPRSRSAVRAWHRALDYVTLTLSSADTAQQPLIIAGLAPLLAGALLQCFPSTATEQELADEPELPESLKDAVSFIHRHAAREVGINDVAAAVHLTPRAVQYLFRRRLGTTPTEYMRSVRLSGAHQDLIGGSTSSTTVTEIAQRWGFAHTGRFAVLYRQTYGQSPHTTLRQTTSSS